MVRVDLLSLCALVAVVVVVVAAATATASVAVVVVLVIVIPHRCLALVFSSIIPFY